MHQERLNSLCIFMTWKQENLEKEIIKSVNSTMSLIKQSWKCCSYVSCVCMVWLFSWTIAGSEVCLCSLAFGRLGRNFCFMCVRNKGPVCSPSNWIPQQPKPKFRQKVARLVELIENSFCIKYRKKVFLLIFSNWRQETHGYNLSDGA